MKYIDAERLKAEVEKRMHICDGVYERDSDTYYQGKAVAYQETLSFITSLQQEQPEVDFEGAYKSYIKSRKDDLSGNAVTVNVKDLARHFYELGLNSKKEGIVI